MLLRMEVLKERATKSAEYLIISVTNCSILMETSWSILLSQIMTLYCLRERFFFLGKFEISLELWITREVPTRLEKSISIYDTTKLTVDDMRDRCIYGVSILFMNIS